MPFIERIITKLNKPHLAEIAKVLKINIKGLTKKEIQIKLREKVGIKKKNFFQKSIYYLISFLITVTSLFYAIKTDIDNRSLRDEIKKLNNEIAKLTGISSETLEHNKFTQRPILLYGNFKLNDFEKVIDGYFAPTISFLVANTGNRDASLIKFRPLIMSLKHKYVRAATFDKKVEFNKLEPNTSQIFTYHPKLQIDCVDDFYYWIQVEYYDEYMSHNFIDTLCFHHYKGREGFGFFESTKEESKKINELLNEELNREGSFLLPDENENTNVIN